MTKNNAWAASLKKAKYAEALTRQIYEKMGCAVTDVSYDPEYQEEDIDMVCTTPDTQRFTIESKSDDTYQYGNFAFENIKNTNTGEPGWGLTTTADLITIYYPTTDIMYILDGHKTVTWFRENQHRFREVTNSTARREGGVLYQSKFRTVNRELFERESGAVLSVFKTADFLASDAL